jgi:hypothetical protein
MNAPDRKSDSLLRSAWSWTLLPLIAWFVSIPFLGAGAFFIPIVVANAPLGIIGYFQKITLSPTPQEQTAIAVIHAGFWLLFITGLSLKRLLPLVWLRFIWFVIVAALFMSVSGCAAQLGAGLRNEGNWH